MTSPTSPPPGWFTDPEDPTRTRWWDGAQWTEHLMPASVPPGSSPTPPPHADGEKASWLRRLPKWAWIVGGLVAVVILVFLAPLVALFALVVLITAIVAVSRKTPTWLRFRSNGIAAAAIAASAVVFVVAGMLSGVIYPSPKTPVAAQSEQPASRAAVASPTPTPSPTPDDVDVAAAASFTGTTATVADTAATDGRSARAILDTLTVRAAASDSGFSRAQFGQSWLDVDRNGCDTRNDTLGRDLKNPVRSGSCKVTSGQLADPYTGTTVAFTRGPGTSKLVQIDHVVSLSNAWQSGAQHLSADQRATFANDAINVLAVSSDAYGAKNGRDASAWLPANAGYQCAYVARQVSVKAMYGLSVTQNERDAMARVLDGCADQGSVTSQYALKAVVPPPAAPAPAEPAPADPAPFVEAPVQEAEPEAPAEPAPAPPANAYYANCKEARAAGAAPIRVGEPGYSRKLDRDGDGIACE